MPTEESIGTRPRDHALVRIAGLIVVVASLAGLAVGLLLTKSLGDDVRSSVSVTQSALEAISQTIEAVDAVAAETAASLDSASASVDSASATVDGAVGAIEQFTEFLDEELPATIASIQTSMPAAIQTANAIDGTLRALSLFGVDYDPDEPFGESLSRVNTALASLPGELRGQSETLRQLIPSAEGLVVETGDLSEAMGELTESLSGFTTLTESYEATLLEAQVAIDRTNDSVESSLWLIRALIIGMAVAGVAIGTSLIVIARSLDAIFPAPVDHDEIDLESVELGGDDLS